MKFIDILKEYNIPYRTEGHHHCRSGWVQIDCPYCGKNSNKYHMGYSLFGKYFNCWRCGGHQLIDVISEITNLSIQQCQKLLGDLEIDKSIKPKSKGKLILPKNIGELLPAHKNYLKSRGYDYKELQKLWHIQSIGISGNLSWRIFIPITYQAETVSWSTRSISNNSNVLRYINASVEQESINHKDLLYGEDYVRQSIIVVEGYFDAWRIGYGAVATMGLNFTLAQINKIIKYPIRVVCLDNEKIAQKRANDLCRILSAFPGETYNIVLDRKDAGESSHKTIKMLRKRFLE